jgi:hypothetical protein
MFAHGKHEAVKRVRPGDWIAYYSPRSEMGRGEEVRAFTAIGRVTDGEPYQAAMGENRFGWRRDVNYADARPADIYPLLGSLSFIRDPGALGRRLPPRLVPGAMEGLRADCRSHGA